MYHEPSKAAWISKTYSELVEIANQDGSILIIPIGSVEQHGKHLPVATDALLVNSVANSGAERVYDSLPVVVAPLVWFGRSPHHLSFGGTLSLQTATLHDLLTDIANTALENEFDSILFLNGHGGNMSIISETVRDIGVDNSQCEILGLTYFHLLGDTIDEIRDSDSGGISHGGELETSLMLYLFSDLVKTDKMEATPRKEPYDEARQDLFEDGPLSVYRSFDEYSSSGAIGEPQLATEKKGKEIFAHLTDDLADLLKIIHKQNKTTRST